MNPMIISIGGAITGLIGGYVLIVLIMKRRKEIAEEEAKILLEKAGVEAEKIRSKGEFDVRDRLQKDKARQDKNHSRRMNELSDRERKLLSQRDQLDQERQTLDRERNSLKSAHDALERDQEKVNSLREEYEGVLDEIRKRLEQVAGMNRDEARKELVESMVSEARQEASKEIKVVEEEFKTQAEEKAQNILSLAMQRISSRFAVERTVSVVNLTNDRIKGRIIGREGRNIRAFEQLTGVDLIIDDTPEAVVLSSHSPLRRQIAKIALERMIEDGRIHPGRIEEIIKQVDGETEKTIRDAGQRAVLDLKINKLHPELVRYMGINMFRTSYSQNILAHSVEVAYMCGIMAAELGISQHKARRAGFLHDIGKAVDKELDGSHAEIGADLCRRFGEKPEIIKAVAQHHDDRPESVLGVLVQTADALSAARPGARREVMTTYIDRLDDMEKIAATVQGVEKAYAIQAGRELRVMVESDHVTDEDASMIGREIAEQIEKSLTYPGQVKVTVLRETRAVAYAK